MEQIQIFGSTEHYYITTSHHEQVFNPVNLIWYDIMVADNITNDCEHAGAKEN